MFFIGNGLIKAAARRRATRFSARNARTAQREIFAMLLRQGAATRFGRDHGFAELVGLPFEAAYDRFRCRVPVRTYGDFWKDYFADGFQTRDGSVTLSLENVTWPGRPAFFCETSGTTAPTKYIPFTREMFAENRRAALDLTACYLAANPGSRLFDGKLLYMAGSTELRPVGHGAWSGDMSAITLRNRPAYLQPFIAPDRRTASLPWEEKVDAMARLLLKDRTIRGISGVPPWILLLLQRCVQLGGRDLPELVPALELIIHGGTSMKPYRGEFDRLFGRHQPSFLELLPSSEAFMAFQVAGEQFMRFAPYYGVFFEFVPFEDLNELGLPRPDGRAVPLEAVDLNRRYAVILSSCAGLWRYHIGDTLRFIGRNPLYMEFTGRDRFLDRFEEKVTQGEVEDAVAAVNLLPGVEVREFLVGPVIAERRHLWVLALRSGGTADDVYLAEQLDARLMAGNADYATFRDQGRIAPPRVVSVDEGTIYAWSKAVRGKLGGQSKIPHIDPTLDGEMVRSLAEFALGSTSVPAAWGSP